MDIDLPEFVLLVAGLSVAVYIAIHFAGRRRRRG
jgi:hypothetical protein